MRTHPLGVICVGMTTEKTFQTATEFSLVTHADPRCVVACCISTGLIRGILRGEVQSEKDVDALIDTAFAWVDAWQKRGRKDEDEDPTEDDWVDASVKIGKAEEISTDEQKQSEEQQNPGPALDRAELQRHTNAKDFEELELDDAMKMGYVYKSLGAAILALRRAIRDSRLLHTSSDKVSFSRNMFENLITSIVMEGGDADTNACIAGALLGSWLGYTALPPHWSDGIDNRDWLLQKCEALSQTIGITNNLPDYRGGQDPDARKDGGKGLLSKEALEAREMAFMEMYLRKGVERNGTEKQKRGWKGKLFSK